MDNLEVQSQSQSAVTKRSKVPKCAKCRVHNIISEKKGHKKLCRFENCSCLKCLNINEKRVVMKNQIKIRRYLEKIERSESSQSGSQSVADQTLVANFEYGSHFYNTYDYLLSSSSDQNLPIMLFESDIPEVSPDFEGI